MRHERLASTNLKAAGREPQISKQLAFYLFCVTIGGGLLSLAGISLLNVVVGWLTGWVVCLIWAIDRIYSDIQNMCMKPEKPAGPNLQPNFEHIRHD